MATSPEDQYRAAWASYALTSDPAEKRALGELMDSLQPKIADGPKDPRWPAFTATMPGYREFWANLKTNVLGGR